ncbi:MAG: hypothetical protein KJ053_02245 [Dehalococcoidia bacterium]|nr:MAG: hypothetical protein EDM74_13920 [Armatimonadota bacterium]MCL4230378.1 hypothetical protein [Dehalococcoidia bacterium]
MFMAQAQGSRANFTGNQLQEFIDRCLVSKGYQRVAWRQFDPGRHLGQAIFAREFPLCKSIYGTDIRSDFVLFHPDKHPDCLVIEAKWQEKAGSVDEKFPYLVANIRERYPHSTIIVLDGGGYKPRAGAWLRKQVGGKLVKVMSMSEFQKWSNSEVL